MDFFQTISKFKPSFEYGDLIFTNYGYKNEETSYIGYSTKSNDIEMVKSIFSSWNIHHHPSDPHQFSIDGPLPEFPECIICLDDKDSKYVILKGCYHIYHFSCIKEWCNKKNSCPYCRIEIKSGLPQIMAEINLEEIETIYANGDSITKGLFQFLKYKAKDDDFLRFAMYLIFLHEF